jgi:hypothetical protein
VFSNSNFSSVVIDTIQSIYEDASPQPHEGGVVLAYHHCQSTNDSESSEKILGGLISQFLDHLPESDPIWTEFLELFNKHQKRSTYPPFSELVSVFSSLTDRIQQMVIIIDALDELPKRESIVDFLEDLSRWEGNFKVLVASRRESDLERAFGFFNILTITPEDTASDLEQYVSKEVRRRWKNDMVDIDEIIQEFVQRADGM